MRQGCCGVLYVVYVGKLLIITHIALFRFLQDTGRMSKSLPLMIDTSQAVILSHTTMPAATKIIPSSTKIFTTTTMKQPISTERELSNAIDQSDSEEDSAAVNIKVLLARQHHQTAQPKLRSTLRSAQVEVFLAIFVSFLLFLVIYSIFTLKQHKLSDKCDKDKLLSGVSIASRSSVIDCSETDFCQPQTIHV